MKQAYLAVLGVVAIVGSAALLMYILPMYQVWQREMAGRAELAQATWNRRIAIEEAQAEKEAATLRAQAEVERAKGAAEAQAIIAETLTEPYLRYLWIQQVEDGDNRQVIYVPTETGLPVLEANRLGQ